MKIKLIRILYFLLLSSIIQINIYSQLTQAELPNIIPPAPNAANLGKFIEVPIGSYTGIPEVNIPIWTIEQGKIKLPITLDYHAGGIKVSEIASWVGLGWSLNAGGIITRTVLGNADETTYGYLNLPLPTNPDYLTKEKYASGFFDSQPDMFYFSLPGKSGRFVFDQMGNPKSIPRQNIKISKLPIKNIPFKYSHVDGDADCITGWEIKTEDGTLYKFTDYELTASLSMHGDYLDLPSDPKYSINSWYLTEIITPEGETIRFTYDTFSYGYDVALSASKYILKAPPANGNPPIKEGEVSCQRQYLNVIRLSSIEFQQGKIMFYPYLKGRADIIGDNALEKVVIEDLSGNIIKQLYLNYNYLVGTDLYDYNSITFNGQNNYFGSSASSTPPTFSRRLLLTSVIEKDKNNNAVNNGYQFEYRHDLGIPNRGYPQTDHWGYANQSEVANPSVLPDFRLIGTPSTGKYVILGKDPNLLFTEQGSISKITYPTGGYSTFEYELNDCVQKTILPGQFTEVGGLSMTIDYYRYDMNEESFEMINGQKQYYKEFTINDKNGSVDIDFTITVDISNASGTPASKANIIMSFYLKNINSTSNLWSNNCKTNGTIKVNVPNGTYRLYHSPYSLLLGNHDYIVNCNIHSATWLEEIPPTSANAPYKIGGLRINKVTMFDPVQSKSLIKSYTYQNETGESSGEILSGISYMYDYEEEIKTATTDNILYYKVYSNNPVYPLLTTQGRYVGYSTTMEQITDLNNNPLGKTILKYRSPSVAPDIYPIGNASADNNQFPFPPADNRDWLRGQLLSREDYTFFNNNYEKIKSVVNDYFIDDLVNIYKVSKGIKYDYLRRSNGLGESKIYAESAYNIYSGYIFLTSSITEEKLGSQTLFNRTYYDYSTESLLPVKTKTYKSDSSVIFHYSTYPLEYSDNTGFIKKLVDNNIVNVPVENITVAEKDGNVTVLSGEIYKYKDNNWGQIDQIMQLETSAPISKSSFKFSARNIGILPPDGSKANFDPDDLYKPRINFDLYDDRGNILQFHKVNDIYTSFIWGYNQTYPVVKAENITSSAFTTAVNTANSNLETLLTSVGDMTTDAQKATWKSFNTSLRSTLPPSTMVSTYTYKPLVGLTSSTDPNGITTYYEYDTFGRLKCIKDDDGRILKTYEYHYKQ